MSEHIIAYEGLAGTCLGVMQEKYVPLYVPWVNLQKSVEGTMQRPPYTVESGIAWVRKLEGKKGTDEVFAVLAKIGTDADELEYIGHMGIHEVSWPKASGVTGSIFGDPKAQRKGYGTEAKLLLLYHCFYRLGLRKVTSSVKAFNGNSIGHLFKCGYTIWGVEKRAQFHEGTFVDVVELEVFREDWEPIWERYQETRKLPSLTDEQRANVQKITGR
jgi:RimJ/RimL family protein N-acetyltransferase